MDQWKVNFPPYNMLVRKTHYKGLDYRFVTLKHLYFHSLKFVINFGKKNKADTQNTCQLMQVPVFQVNISVILIQTPVNSNMFDEGSRILDL